MNCKPARLLPLGAMLLAGLLLASLLLGAGCATDARHAGGIGSLHVFTAPVALDLDPPPGADAIGVTVYASAAATARGLPITNGRMEIQMYDGVLAKGMGTNAAPRHAWTFVPADLQKLGIKTSLGHGYRFALRWNDTPPLQDRITIVARYTTARDTVIESAPTTIVVTTK